MDKNRPIELSDLLDHGDGEAVLRWWRDSSALMYPEADFSKVEQAFPLVADLYGGRFPGYVPCRTNYHDYRHTIDVFVATVRLLDGCLLEGRGVDAELAEDTMAAALLHDVGYIQDEHDTEGTGAKYTATHVVRSVDFLHRHRGRFGLEPSRADRIGRIILGTDLGIPWDKLSLQDSGEARSASILASADLLGQMGDRAYLEKLLFLYYEFKEAGFGGYDSAFDILRKTAGFYASVKSRLDSTLGSVSRAAKVHFAARIGEDRDLYRESIARQMSYLDSILEDDTVNFRKRLRRMDLEEVEQEERRRLASFGVAAAYDPA